MATEVDETTLTTLNLLEARLLRIEHVLHGHSGSPTVPQNESAAMRLASLERRFNGILSKIPVYHALLQIYNKQPDLFHAASPSEPPSTLDIDTICAIVLAAAPQYQSTLSLLTSVKDTPIPDPTQSAALIATRDRLKALEATQIGQAAEAAELRSRSEAVVRAWYEGSVLRKSQFMSDLEGRVELVERAVRRAERERKVAQEI